MLICVALLFAYPALAAPDAPAAHESGHDPTPLTAAGGGTHEIVADSRRPLIYQVYPSGQYLLFRNASTGQLIESLSVGPSPTSVDFSDDGNSLYVAISGANQIALVDIDTRSIVRTINLDFSPLCVRDGRPDRLFVSGKGDSLVRVVNETSGAVITTFEPLALFEALFDVSPNGSEVFVHVRVSPVWMLRYSVEMDNPVLLASTSEFMGQEDQVIVDWGARVVYFSTSVPYGIKLISLDTLQSLRDFRTDGYPAGIALLADQHLVFGLNDFSPYRSGLWAFNTSTGELVREVPMSSELDFVVAAPSTQMVLVWTPYGVRAFPLGPAVSPSAPEPSARLTYVPPSVSAVVWTGIPEVAFDRAGISLNGRPLYSVFTAPDTLVGYVQPPIRVGIWTLTADIVWPGGSRTATWIVTFDPPPPSVFFDSHPRSPFFAGHAIQFDASGSSAQVGLIVAYVWDFGDGSTAVGNIVNHTYTNPGEYVVTLDVSTDIGQFVSQSRTILVQVLTTVPEGSMLLPEVAAIAAAVVGAAVGILRESLGRRGTRRNSSAARDAHEKPLR